MSTARDAGFTLLEVLIAMAILSIAVVASIDGFAQGLRLLKLAGEHQQAVLLADEKAREIVTPKEGHESGQAQRGTTTFTWETDITPVQTPSLVPDAASTTTTAATSTGAVSAWRMYQIAVHVRWDGHRQVEIDTLRTVPLVTEAAPPGATPIGTTPPPGTPSIGTPTRPLPGMPGTMPGLR